MVVYFVRSAMFVYEEKVLANRGEAEQLWNFSLLILIEYYNSLHKLK